MEKYQIKNYSHLTGISEIKDSSMQLHFKLYEGYVNNTNLILEKLKTLEINSPEWNEINRRLGWEWNGMRNHEIFFDSLGKEQGNFAAQNFPVLSNKISEDFQTFENWKHNFQSICKIRGIGWAMLVQDKNTKKLQNLWVNEHDAGMLSDVNIILNVDMFEHAYIIDFGTDRQKYLDSIFLHINWKMVESRII